MNTLDHWEGTYKNPCRVIDSIDRERILALIKALKIALEYSILTRDECTHAKKLHPDYPSYPTLAIQGYAETALKEIEAVMKAY